MFKPIALSAMGAVFAVLFLCSIASAQPPDDSEPQAQDNAGPMMNQGAEGHWQMMEQSKQMEEMAKAMTSMARMCETMMEMEMERAPWMMVAGAVVGTLLTVALALFVVLEIQWIRFWHYRLKAEKRTNAP